MYNTLTTNEGIISEDAVIIVAGMLSTLLFTQASVDNVVVLQYTWTNSRLWRKNRRKGTLCDGVDLNRNYNSMWGGVSHSAASNS